MKQRLLTLILIVPLLVCCNKQPDPKIDITGGTEFSFTEEAGSGTVTFTSNTDWTATASESWVTVSPTSGAGSDQPAKITITCEPNTDTEARTATVTIKAGELTKTVTINQEGAPAEDWYAKAAPELKNGDKVLATNRNAEKFLSEVTYPDKDWSYTKVLDYYGGYNAVKYDENGNPDENGTIVKKPVSDKPESYSIRWKPDASAGNMTLHLADKLGWSSDVDITEGKAYVDITNLVPNDHYTYKVTAANGKVMAEGAFDTEGHVHQCFFKSDCRNCRDLGGWKTIDGKTIKYRKIYRGGRMQGSTLSKTGKQEVLAEGIGAQLDLRGHSDMLSESPVPGVDFLAPCIEQGGTTMLVSDKEKTKACFEFVLNAVRQGKGVYFHCSLGRDRTGTLSILLMGLLGVREGDISKEYELTYFAPFGYSVSEGEQSEPYVFKNHRMNWVYSDVVPYFWGLSTDGTFASGVEKYLIDVAGVTKAEIDEFRSLMLE